MDATSDYLELKKKYNELQLRITRFSVIEQELIHARNLMDREVLIYRLMQQFNTRALEELTDKQFCILVAESLLEIFEVEVAYVCFDIPETGAAAIRHIEGFDPGPDKLYLVQEYIAGIFTDLPSGTLRNFEARPTDKIRDVFPARDLLITQLWDPEKKMSIQLLAGITEKGKPFYDPIRKDREAAFTVFCQQVLGHQLNRHKNQTIQEQYKALASEQKRITTIAELLLNFDTNPEKNIQQIVSLTNELLGGTCSIYEKTETELIYFSAASEDIPTPDWTEINTLFQVLCQSEQDILCRHVTADIAGMRGGEWLRRFSDHILLASVVRVDKKPVGTLGIVLDSSVQVNDSTFQLIRILSAAIMVEERRKYALKALSESEEKYRMIFEGTPNGIIIADPVSHQFLFVNHAACQLFGYSEKEFLALKITDIHPPEDAERIVEIFEKIGRDELRNVEEIPCLHKNKTLFFTDIYSNRIRFGGRTLIAGFFADVTQRRNDRRSILENNTELKKINAELDNFVYSVSHDLRSPLLAILGLVQLIQNRQKDPDAINRYITMIAQSANRMDDTIKEILEYSRNARLEHDIREINFEDLIQQTFNDVKHISQDPVQLEYSIEQDSPFYSDIYRVGTIFKNIISNAVKYRKKAADNNFLKIKINSGNLDARIEFADNGEGIPAQHQDRVFDMFYRASSSAPGTGLGLYICKEMVNNLNGTINVESSEGNGSVFTVTLQNKYKLQ